MKPWIGLGISLAVGLVGYGALQSDVRGHDRRIETLETDQRVRSGNEVQLVQRLASIEARLNFLVEAESRRQQRDGR